MSYLVIYTEKSEPNSKTIFVEIDADLVDTVERLEKSGKGVKIDIYEATKKSYKIEYDDVPKTIIEKVPRIVIT